MGNLWALYTYECTAGRTPANRRLISHTFQSPTTTTTSSRSDPASMTNIRDLTFGLFVLFCLQCFESMLVQLKDQPRLDWWLGKDLISFIMWHAHELDDMFLRKKNHFKKTNKKKKVFFCCYFRFLLRCIRVSDHVHVACFFFLHPPFE